MNELELLKSLSIYLAGSISGKTVEEVRDYFTNFTKMFSDMGYQVYSPMTGKGNLRVSKTYDPLGYTLPVATDHAIFNRDRWMVGKADIIFCNLFNSIHVSIGSMMELAWARELRKHIIIVMEERNIHEHAFVIECADIRFTDIDDAISYVESLIYGVQI